MLRSRRSVLVFIDNGLKTSLIAKEVFSSEEHPSYGKEVKRPGDIYQMNGYVCSHNHEGSTNDCGSRSDEAFG
ncbi:unnamed protein product [Leptosia nina]|uniref:Uncharacterized protein n=1 Tax=Leptosia nina TaxID=320188 RepID=A0AAV1J6J5_9NEOP